MNKFYYFSIKQNTRKTKCKLNYKFNKRYMNLLNNKIFVGLSKQKVFYNNICVCGWGEEARR